MAQIVINDFTGQDSSKNPTPKPVAITQAKNVVFDGGSISPRPGFRAEGATSVTGTINRLLASGANVYAASNNLLYKSPSSWTAYTGALTPPLDDDGGDITIYQTTANQNLYFTSKNGIRKLEAHSATALQDAGVARPLDATASAVAAWAITTAYTVGTVVTNDTVPVKYYRCTVAGTSAGAGGPTGTGSTITDNTVTWTYVSSASTATAAVANNKYAYRFLLGYRDTNKNVLLSAPNQRTLFTRLTGAATTNVNCRVYIPSSLTSSSPVCFYQAYRSLGSGTDATEPSDEMGLVYEANLSSTDISNKYVDFIDVCPDALIGPTGYFCSSQDGILQANYPPPAARDIAHFNGYTFFAGVGNKHRMTLMLLSVDTATGVRVDDTITVAGQTYTGKSTETVASRQFKVTTSGTTQQNVEDTARSLIRCINGNTSNTTVYAYYASAYNDTAGKIIVETRTVDINSLVGVFNATASANGTAWNPPLPTSGTTVASTNDFWKNGLMWSKPGLPEAVPLVNYKRIGSADHPIQRLITTTNAMYIFKTDGLWRLTGDVAPFSLELINNKVEVGYIDAIAAFQDSVYFLNTDAKVMRVSDYSLVDVSGPIHRDLRQSFGAMSPSGVASNSIFLMGMERRGYLLVNNGAEGFVFDGKRWATWTYPTAGSLVVGSESTYWPYFLIGGVAHRLGGSGTQQSASNYGDVPAAIPIISSVVGSTITFNAARPSTMAVGDTIVAAAGAGLARVLTLVSTNAVTVDSTTGFAALAGVGWYPQTECSVTFRFSGEPFTLKQFRDIQFAFGNKKFVSGLVYVTSDLSSTESASVVIAGDATDVQRLALSTTTATNLPSISRAQNAPVRTFVLREQQVCNQLSVRFTNSDGLTYWILDGVAVDVEPLGTESVR